MIRRTDPTPPSAWPATSGATNPTLARLSATFVLRIVKLCSLAAWSANVTMDIIEVLQTFEMFPVHDLQVLQGT